MNNCRVVLVRPHFAGNIGAVARVMHNFGLSALTLVQPIADHHADEARRMATHGEFILDRASVCREFVESVADCRLCVATSAKVEGVVRKTVCGSAGELMPRVATEMRQGPVALVFVPEPSGLTTAEISRCHYLLYIPASPEYPSLNLAQAVAIGLYELHEAWRSSEVGAADGSPPASFAEQERMFAHLQKGLAAIHFLYGAKSESLMSGIRHLIGRARPTPTEVKILHGLARQLEWAADHGPTAAPPHRDDP
jgi:tRNA/rRNA methyltransferase